jgi:hypothetical protein
VARVFGGGTDTVRYLTDTYRIYIFVRMETKLTLKIRRKIIERGKRYALKRKTSLSKLIENYLERITSEEDDSEITPLVKSLSGIVRLDENYDHKKSYANFLAKKYK